MARPVLLAWVVAAMLAGCDRGSSPTRTAPNASPPKAQAPAGASHATTTSTSNDSPAPDRAGEKDDADPHEKLYGTWVSKDVPTSAGDVKIQVTFRQEGPVRIVAWSELPFVGKVRETKGPYEVHGNTISSSAIRGGTSVQYWFDQGELIIKYSDGKTVRLHRQK